MIFLQAQLDLDRADVDLISVPSNKPEAVDLKIQNTMYRVMEERNPATTTLVLISGDYDFVGQLRMAYEKGFRVVLIHSNMLGGTRLLGFAQSTHKMFIWEDIMGGLAQEEASSLSKKASKAPTSASELDRLPVCSAPVKAKDLPLAVKTGEMLPYFGPLLEALEGQGSEEVELARLGFMLKKSVIHFADHGFLISELRHLTWSITSLLDLRDTDSLTLDPSGRPLSARKVGVKNMPSRRR